MVYVPPKKRTIAFSFGAKYKTFRSMYISHTIHLKQVLVSIPGEYKTVFLLRPCILILKVAKKTFEKLSLEALI